MTDEHWEAIFELEYQVLAAAKANNKQLWYLERDRGGSSSAIFSGSSRGWVRIGQCDLSVSLGTGIENSRILLGV